MRRLTATAVRICLLAPVLATAALAGPAAAQTPTGAPADGESSGEAPEPGESQCEITDPRLVELSGLVATDDGYIVVNDQTDFVERLPIFVLDHACQVVEQLFFPTRPYDPEALALDRANDVLWVGDTGDNGADDEAIESRQTVALWRVELAGDRNPVIHRFAYPDGPRDAEALLIDGDGTPVIVTKNMDGTAGLYKPAEEPVPNNPHEQAVPLERVGEFEVPETGSGHPILPAAAARIVITGGGTSPDGNRVVLRSYTDAFEFDVTDGDVVGAITGGEPRITPLPDEPWGEAITYSPDGARFLTVSEVPEQQDSYTPEILSYTPVEPEPTAPPATDGADDAASGSGGGSLFSNMDLRDLFNLIAVVGVLGVLLVGAGVFGIVRSRRRASGGTDDAADGTPARVTGRANLTGGPSPTPPGQVRAEPAGGVYTSGAVRSGREPAAGYGGSGYPPEEDPPDPRFAQRPTGHPDEYRSGGRPRPPTEYGGGGYQERAHGGHRDGYQDHGYGGHGYGEYDYGDHGYAAPGYGGHGHRPRGYEDHGYGREYEGYATAPQAGAGPGDAGGYGYADPRYADPRYADAGYADAGYADAGYGSGADPWQPYNQDWSGHDDRPGYPGGHHPAGDHRPGGHQTDAYPPGPYQGRGYRPDDYGGGYEPAGPGYPPDDGYQGAYGGGGYGGTYGGGRYPSGAPDDYSDDPDYPYEFRDRRR